MEKRDVLTVILLLIVLNCTIIAQNLPFTPPESYEEYKKEVKDYYYIKKESKNRVFGYYWSINFRSSTPIPQKAFIQSIVKKNPQFMIIKRSGLSTLFKLKQNQQIFWFNVIYHNRWFEVKAIKETAYKKILTINSKNSPHYKSKVKNKLPECKVLPFIENAVITRPVYQNYNKLDLSKRVKKAKATYSGNYWQADYLFKNKKGSDRSYQVLHNYRDEIKKAGGQILYQNRKYLLTSLKAEDSVFITFLESNPSISKFRIVKQSGFVQSLIIDPDKLKAELDRTGKVTLKGIYFDTNKATLKPESQKAVDAAATLLKKYPDLKLIIKGHTDNTGNSQKNMALSNSRAASVKDAIVKVGIESSRLKSKGYGSSLPVASNSSAEGRSKNRRVELCKIGGGKRRAVIDVKFIKPMPDSKLVSHRKYQNRPLNIGKKGKKLSIKGPSEIVKYFLSKKSISKVEIKGNYRNSLKLLGAKILQEKPNALYFMFEDRGDGKKVYGKVTIYGSTYTIQLHLE